MNRRKVLRWVLGGLGIVLAVVVIIWLLPGGGPSGAALTGTPLPFTTPAPAPTLNPHTPPGENASLVCSTSLIVLIIIGAVLIFRWRKPPE